MTNRRIPTDNELARRAARLASRAGLDWSSIADQSTELIVFGSQAAGLQKSSSDLDVLVVTAHRLTTPLAHFRGIDLVFRTEEEIHSTEWLSSELAGHIAVYGRWLQGSGRWRDEALAAANENQEATEAKRVRICRLAQALRSHWSRLTPDFRHRNLITLRRETQRLQLLQSGTAIPPTRLLDTWAENNSLDSRCYEQVQCGGDVSRFYSPVLEGEWQGRPESVSA